MLVRCPQTPPASAENGVYQLSLVESGDTEPQMQEMELWDFNIGELWYQRWVLGTPPRLMVSGAGGCLGGDRLCRWSPRARLHERLPGLPRELPRPSHQGGAQ